MKDEYLYRGMRRKMIARLRRQGITDERVLRAMEAVPRHLFLRNSSFYHHAYSEGAFPIGEAQTLSRPYTVAFQSAALDVGPGLKVLEIGTGSGYQASILAALGAEVHSVERFLSLAKTARKRLAAMKFTGIHIYHGDGYAGLPDLAPFDRIIVTAGAPQVPQALLEQLTTGGQLLIPVGDKVQRMLSIRRRGAKTYSRRELGTFKFVPFLPGKR